MATRIPNYDTIREKHEKALRKEFEKKTCEYFKILQEKIKNLFSKEDMLSFSVIRFCGKDLSIPAFNIERGNCSFVFIRIEHGIIYLQVSGYQLKEQHTSVKNVLSCIKKWKKLKAAT